MPQTPWLAAPRAPSARPCALQGPGARVYEIGRAVEREVRRNGFRVLREFGGHGIGRTIHEDPHVPNYPRPHATAPGCTKVW